MPYCIRCGREAAPTDRYCLNCGQAIFSVESHTTTESHSISFCPNCGVLLSPEVAFCTNCGFDVKSRAQQEASEGTSPTRQVRGLSRNSVIYLTQEGLRGFKVGSDTALTLALSLPFFAVLIGYFFIRAGAPVAYLTAWIVAAGLLYDELRWRGFRRLLGRSLDDLQANMHSWLVPWHSLRMADWNGRTLWFTSTNPALKASATFDTDDAHTVENALSEKGLRYSWRSPRLPPRLTGFWELVILFFIAAQVIMILAATLPFFPGEAQMYNTILNNTTSQVRNASAFGEFRAIYLNNVQVAWGGAVPYFGALAFAVASYNTGRVIQVIALGDNVSSLLVLVSLYILPHTWVEEFSYPLATVAGILSVTRWRSVSPAGFTRRLNRGSTKLVLALCASAVTLLFAGALEVAATYMHYAVLVLWVPIALVLYYAVNWGKRHDKATLE